MGFIVSGIDHRWLRYVGLDIDHRWFGFIVPNIDHWLLEFIVPDIDHWWLGFIVPDIGDWWLGLDHFLNLQAPWSFTLWLLSLCPFTLPYCSCQNLPLKVPSLLLLKNEGVLGAQICSARPSSELLSASIRHPDCLRLHVIGAPSLSHVHGDPHPIPIIIWAWVAVHPHLFPHLSWALRLAQACCVFVALSPLGATFLSPLPCSGQVGQNSTSSWPVNVWSVGSEP